MVATSKLDLSQFKSDVFKFAKDGDSILGELLDMSIETSNLDKDKEVLLLVVKDSETGRATRVYCPTMLAAAVAEEDPDIGDIIRATMTGSRNVGRPSPLKEFDFEIVEHRNGS